MIRIINSEDEFARLLELQNSLIFENTVLPSRIFREEYQFFRCVDEARVMNPEFLDLILELSKHFGFDEILYIKIEPDPSVSYSKFHKYGAFVFDTSSTFRDIAKSCFESPVINRGDANKSALIPICRGLPDWCVYRDRTDCEVGIIAFKNKDIADAFIGLDKDNITMDAIEAIETIISLGFRDRMPEYVKEEFLRNYT